MHRFYKHYKGRYYQVVGEALDAETDEAVVVYRTLYASGHALFTRSYGGFHGVVNLPDGTVVSRFLPVDYDDLPEEARSEVLVSLML